MFSRISKNGLLLYVRLLQNQCLAHYSVNAWRRHSWSDLFVGLLGFNSTGSLMAEYASNLVHLVPNQANEKVILVSTEPLVYYKVSNTVLPRVKIFLLYRWSRDTASRLNTCRARSLSTRGTATPGTPSLSPEAGG